MPQLFGATRFLQKPPPFATINWRHPISKGLVFYQPYLSPNINELTSYVPTGGDPTYHKVGSWAGFTTGPYGLTQKWDGTGSAYVTRTTALEPSAAVTLAGRVRRGGTLPSFCVPFMKTYNNNASSPFLSYDVEYNPNGHGQNQVIADVTTGGTLHSTAEANIGNFIPDSSVDHTIAMTYDGATLSLVLNGNPVSTAAVSGTISYDTTATGNFIISGVSAAAATNEWIGDIYWVGVWNRALANAELMRLHLDPYCLLTLPGSPIQPQLLIASGFIPVSMGGGIRDLDGGIRG